MHAVPDFGVRVGDALGLQAAVDRAPALARVVGPERACGRDRGEHPAGRRRVEQDREGIVFAARPHLDVLLEIDWQGAAQVRKLFPHMVGIFILPPSLAELRKRLESRGKDSPETIARRTASTREDISHVLEFEYIIVNDRFEAALTDLRSIVRAARVSRAQQAVRLASLLDEFK